MGRGSGKTRRKSTGPWGHKKSRGTRAAPEKKRGRGEKGEIIPYGREQDNREMGEKQREKRGAEEFKGRDPPTKRKKRPTKRSKDNVVPVKLFRWPPKKKRKL